MFIYQLTDLVDESGLGGRVGRRHGVVLRGRGARGHLARVGGHPVPRQHPGQEVLPDHHLKEHERKIMFNKVSTQIMEVTSVLIKTLRK